MPDVIAALFRGRDARILGLPCNGVASLPARVSRAERVFCFCLLKFACWIRSYRHLIIIQGDNSRREGLRDPTRNARNTRCYPLSHDLKLDHLEFLVARRARVELSLAEGVTCGISLSALQRCVMKRYKTMWDDDCWLTQIVSRARARRNDCLFLCTFSPPSYRESDRASKETAARKCIISPARHFPS